MKKGLFIIYSLLVFFSCSEKEVIQETIKPTVTFFPLFVGERVYTSIEMKADDYQLKNNNPQVVAWEYTKRDSVICVYPLSAGIGSLDVLDMEGNIRSIISVTACDFDSRNIEEISMHRTEKPDVYVEANNSEIKQLIEDELWRDMKQKSKTKYTFDSDTKEFTMNNPRQEQMIEGTFDWSIDSLILKYNDVTERYDFKIATGRICYVIQADKTEEYQLLYPDAGITSVKVKRIWYDWVRAELPKVNLNIR